MKKVTKSFAALSLLLSLTACTAQLTLGVDKPGSSSTPKPAVSSSPTATASPAVVASPSVVVSQQPTTMNVEEVEPNSDFDKAFPVTTNAVITGSIGQIDVSDFFLVTIPEGTQDGFLKINLLETNQYFTPHIIIFNQDKTQLEDRYPADGTTSPFTWDIPVSPGKSFYLKLENYPDARTPYTLNLNFVPVPDTFEPNNKFETAKVLESGKTVDLYMFSGYENTELKKPDADEDFFKIEVPADKKFMKVNIENKSTSDAKQNFHVILFDPNKTQINDKYGDNDQANLSTLFAAAVPGTYYLKFDNSYNSAVPSKLTVTLE